MWLDLRCFLKKEGPPNIGLPHFHPQENKKNNTAISYIAHTALKDEKEWTFFL